MPEERIVRSQMRNELRLLITQKGIWLALAGIRQSSASRDLPPRPNL